MTRTFGPAYDERLDGSRLATQFASIRDYALTHGWRTLAEISADLGYPESSVSAQLRHARKERFGTYRLQKRRRTLSGGTWEYRLLPPLQQGQTSLFDQTHDGNAETVENA